jgi:acetate kinase
MNILVFNCGSSSLNYKLYQTGSNENLTVLASGKAHRVNVKGTEPAFIEHHWENEHQKIQIPLPDHAHAARSILKHLNEQKLQIESIGHRFVHGGELFQKSTLLDNTALEKLEQCLPLAPIHNPNSMSVIMECRHLFPGSPQFAVFDTAFHASLPDYASTYALPYEITQKYSLRKFGFHGLSYTYVSRFAAKYLDVPLSAIRIIACHLGTGGSSIAAISNGYSVDTSMGYTPLAGLMMSTRTGDFDPMLPLHMQTELGFTPQDLNRIFNKESGLLGVSGFSSDLRDIEKQLENNDRAKLAFDMYTYRLKQYIGAYIATLGGLDVLIFTDDIGVKSWRVRETVCNNMEFCGISLNNERNQAASYTEISEINTSDSKVKILAMPTDEESIICREGVTLLNA